MQSHKGKNNKRQQNRTRAVLPVRVRGKDISGEPFEALAHTLDLASTGARLGALRVELKSPATLTIFYHQRRKDFNVVWTKRLEGTSEYQIGLEAVTQESEPWGLNLPTSSERPVTKSASSGAD
jgi:hypothetical protein